MSPLEIVASLAIALVVAYGAYRYIKNRKAKSGTGGGYGGGGGPKNPPTQPK